VLVTGGAGGLGAATVGLLADLGWHVFCGDLGSPELARVGARDGVTPLVLDVTDGDSVAAAAELVGAQVDGLDAVVNFAGVLGVGSVLEIDEAELHRVLDVNVFGTYRVNRAFFPLVHRRRGRIVNLSSETGHQQGAPFNGPYAMSKHAIEAYSDSLRRELRFLGVEVIKIRPGPFRTGMVAGIERAFTRAAESSTYFPATIERVKDLAVRENDKANDPAVLAQAIHRALTTRRPRAAYGVREDRARAVLDRLPTRLSDLILEKVMSPRDPVREDFPIEVEWTEPR
jgi:NAD(P)-dependent dehydrogenase (short-subunit alcohol dehydrogenase family)